MHCSSVVLSRQGGQDRRHDVPACLPAPLQCYKAVPLLMEKQLRRSASGQQRANVMYAVSKLLRESKRELKARSKYGERQHPGTAAAEAAAAVNLHVNTTRHSNATDNTIALRRWGCRAVAVTAKVGARPVG